MADRDGAAGRSLAWLGHPATVLALVVLLLNDHVLKAAMPGWVTGKLSDVAGLVLAPPLVATLAGLLAPRLPGRATVVGALVAVGAGFAAVKSSGYAAHAASVAWSAVSGPCLVRADVTDLLALPALGVAAWAWTRARRHPAPRRAVRLVRLVVLLPGAVLAVAATSAVYVPDAVLVVAADGRLVAGVHDGAAPGPRPVRTWLVSDDGAVTWRPVPHDARPTRVPEAARSACSAAEPRRCYRVLDGRIGVDRSDDAGRSWMPEWRVPEASWHLLARRYTDLGDPRERLSSVAVAVQDLGGGGHVVVLANGRDGFAVRRPDGAWHRTGFPAGLDPSYYGDLPALDAAGPAERPYDLLLVVALALVLTCAVPVLGSVRVARLTGAGRWWPLALPALLGFSGALLAAVWTPVDGVFAVPAVGSAVFVAALVAVAALVPAWSVRRMPAGWGVEVAAATALTLVLTLVPLVGWLYARPPAASTAVLLALVATAPGLVLAWRAVRVVSRPPVPLPPGGGAAR